MAYYDREEQETIYNFDPIEKCWHVYSSYPPHIRRIIERADVIKTVKDDEGRIIEASGRASTGQVRLFKPT